LEDIVEVTGKEKEVNGSETSRDVSVKLHMIDETILPIPDRNTHE
jgi:hypothetical protein